LVAAVLIADIDLRTSALLLDVDGTILDIAATPRDVKVPPRLTRALGRLAQQTGGAVAFVSGRPLGDLDRLFAPLRIAVISGHGAELRIPGAEPEIRTSPPLGADLRRALVTIAAGLEGVILEDKGYSVALHYRLARASGRDLERQVRNACTADPAIEVLPGKEVIEVKRADFNKGTGVRELMRHAPFRGRRPLFIGDDVTDEAVFAVLPEFDGIGFSVGHRVPDLAGYFPGPNDVRRWLYRIVGENVASDDGAAAS
jgi:trehalose 6-phosphate phosphatase